MTPQFQPILINGPFDDPGVFIDFLFERRAMLFDLGEITALPPRKILRISHVFVSHTHVDHFIGFDHLVRICLGRDKKVHLFGPPEFVDQIWHRLASYTWNLVENYPTDFTVVATELHPDGKALSAEFHCMKGFPPEKARSYPVDDGVILDEDTFRVRLLFLDHKTPSLAFTLEEKSHVNIMKNRLEELGLPVGPWLWELKRAVLRGEADDTPFRAWWRKGETLVERHLPLGELKESVLRVVPGQKITYITDTAYNRDNVARIAEFARNSDYLFIEAAFLHEEAERAAEKYHLTASQAGFIAREAGAGRIIPFHFSAKYRKMEERLRQEVAQTFAG